MEQLERVIAPEEKGERKGRRGTFFTL